jgi:hypothetical protein
MVLNDLNGMIVISTEFMHAPMLRVELSVKSPSMDRQS